MAFNDSALNLFLQTKVIYEIGPLLPEAQFCDDETGDHIIKETTHEKQPCILWLTLSSSNTESSLLA